MAVIILSFPTLVVFQVSGRRLAGAERARGRPSPGRKPPRPKRDNAALIVRRRWTVQHRWRSEFLATAVLPHRHSISTTRRFCGLEVWKNLVRDPAAMRARLGGPQLAHGTIPPLSSPAARSGLPIARSQWIGPARPPTAQISIRVGNPVTSSLGRAGVFPPGPASGIRRGSSPRGRNSRAVRPVRPYRNLLKGR
jgi:hypothetical protein